MTNEELAGLFSELAQIMEIAGEDHFKIRAYRNAAEIISSSQIKITKLTVDQLQQIEGIGKAISEKIIGAEKTGTFPTLEKWRQTGFASLRPLLNIPGLTMRKLRTMMKDLNISTVAELKAAIVDERFPEYLKLGENIKTTIAGLIENDRLSRS
jgi:DNA polymerase (family X)